MRNYKNYRDCEINLCGLEPYRETVAGNQTISMSGTGRLLLLGVEDFSAEMHSTIAVQMDFHE